MSYLLDNVVHADRLLALEIGVVFPGMRLWHAYNPVPSKGATNPHAEHLQQRDVLGKTAKLTQLIDVIIVVPLLAYRYQTKALKGCPFSGKHSNTADDPRDGLPCRRKWNVLKRRA